MWHYANDIYIISARMVLTASFVDKMNFKFHKFSEATALATKSRWEEVIEQQGMFNLDYKRVLDDLSTHIDYATAGQGEYRSYGIFGNGDSHASAVVSIVYTPKPRVARGWLKMLEVKLSPDYDEGIIMDDLGKLGEAIEIYAAAIFGTLSLRDVHRANVVKLYGRSSALLKFLVAVGTALKAKNLPNVEVSNEGRWLVISKS